MNESAEQSASQGASLSRRIESLLRDVKILAAHSAALEDAIYHADWRAAEKSRCELPEHLRMLMQDGEK